MEKKRRTIDDIFEMCDSRYSLVNAISKKAREIADEAESNHDVLYRKPVNMVIDRLLDGRATIEHIEPEEEQEHHYHVSSAQAISYTLDSDDDDPSYSEGQGEQEEESEDEE